MSMPSSTDKQAFSVSIQVDDFDIRAEQRYLTNTRGQVGAIVAFTGLVRDFNQRPDVVALTLEHYPGMTERSLEQLLDEARERFSLNGARIIHRVGRLEPGDNIVLVLVASAHRQAAFAACDFLMDNLKSRAPFWKKEHTASGDYWVRERTSDRDALMRWQLPVSEAATNMTEHPDKPDPSSLGVPQTSGET
ncbi:MULTISPECIES: molybdopterin synthase catalytic subunit MoaE [Cobetia]|nr:MULTISPECIES: molybdopterin synthase catalytic subunit MoaE [Cobetia]